MVLLLVEGLAILGSQFAIIHLSHVALFLVKSVLLLLQIAGLVTGELAALDALVNAGLLVVLALPNSHRLLSGIGCSCSRVLSESCRCEQRCDGESNHSIFHGYRYRPLLLGHPRVLSLHRVQTR